MPYILHNAATTYMYSVGKPADIASWTSPQKVLFLVSLIPYYTHTHAHNTHTHRERERERERERDARAHTHTHTHAHAFRAQENLLVMAEEAGGSGCGGLPVGLLDAMDEAYKFTGTKNSGT